ncbi:MAG: hypothetical protein QOG26_1608 [Solirubrobacterales bacterium]|nr:hypothetical protein [Solirubrobacterales bacterium]
MIVTDGVEVQIWLSAVFVAGLGFAVGRAWILTVLPAIAAFAIAVSVGAGEHFRELVFFVVYYGGPVEAALLIGFISSKAVRSDDGRFWGALLVGGGLLAILASIIG